MKLYRESMRRLGRVGITLMVVTLVLTVVYALQGANEQENTMLKDAIRLMPVLPVFDYVAGVAFAFFGFSFLNKRADSDFYHSIPVSRRDLFCSISLAALTWIAATVALSAALTAAVLAAGGTPFVPAYIPLNIGFHIVAAMLVYAAAAIGCSLTGTLLSNVIVTGIVLFLPRYLLFIVARGIVAETYIVSWLDLPWLLDPSTNIATGLAVMLSRNMFISRIVTLPHILYSLGLAAIELAAGCWLFTRRPSELAEQGAASGKLQTAYACLVTLPLLLLLSVLNSRNGTYVSWPVLVVVLISIVVYVVYQSIVLRNRRRVLLSLPWYLVSAAVAFSVILGGQIANNRVLNDLPKAEEIDYVLFPGYDSQDTLSSYTSKLISEIAFASDAVKADVAENLETAVDNVILGYPYGSTYESYERNYLYAGNESVVIVLKNGRRLMRTFTFRDIDALNACRAEEPRFVSAVRAFPSGSTVKYRNNYSGLSEDDVEKLRICYFDECAKLSIVPDDYYRPHEFVSSSDYYQYPEGDEQNYGNITVGGYIGTRRYVEHYSINADTPRTAALWMMLMNRYAVSNNMESMQTAFRYVRAEGENNPKPYYNDNFNASMTFSNVKLDGVTPYQVSFNTYLYGYEQSNPSDSYVRQREYGERVLAVLSRGVQTTDPTDFNVSYCWNAGRDNRWTGSFFRNGERRQQYVEYLSFSPADERELTSILNEWLDAMNGYDRRVSGEPLSEDGAACSDMPLSESDEAVADAAELETGAETSDGETTQSDGAKRIAPIMATPTPAPIIR